MMPRETRAIPPPPVPQEAPRSEPLTAWQRHEVDTRKARTAERRACLQQVHQCETWEGRSLLCRLGIHRPYEQVGLIQNDFGAFQCLRCGYRWNGVVR